MNIYGAGLAGLLAGIHFPQAQIFEARSEGDAQHKALLRFRSRAVGDAVGIDFKHVRVRKSIYHEGKHHAACNPALANLYSKKVTGRILDRSIWDLEAADRWIAPDDLLQQLADRCRGRITWNYNVGNEILDTRTHLTSVSTLPMNVMARLLGVEAPAFERSKITVFRAKVSGADVHQTIYYPGGETFVYRASMVGDSMIIEAVCKGGHAILHNHLVDVYNSFGLEMSDITPIDSSSQEYGKLSPIDDQWRKRFIFELSQRHNIFSLGRFGTWRNILLDDVLDDIFVIKRLIAAGQYSQILSNATT